MSFLFAGSSGDASADRRGLALGILADDHHVDAARLAVAEWRRHSAHQAHRPQIHVLVKATTDGKEQSPERHVVGHTGESDCAEEDRVEAAQLVEAVTGPHLSGL